MPPPLTYAFQPREDISHGFVRVLRAISTRARGLSRRSREPAADSIHEVRLLIKRARALLWFARPVLDAPEYARARTRMRKAALLLAGERDREVTRLTLEELAKKASKTRDRTAIGHTVRSLIPNPDESGARKKLLRATLKKAVGILCLAVEGTRRSAAAPLAWPSPRERVAKAFRATRRAGKKARRTGKDADFHAWRKKAKRLLYQLELTQAEPARRLTRAINRAAKLQDTLGAYHDCVVVEDHLRRMLPLPPAERRVAGLLEKRKARLRKKACLLSRRLEAPV